MDAGELAKAADAAALPLSADVVAVPITVVPWRMVNVTVPPFTTPAALVTVADRVTDCPELLNVADTSAAAVVVPAALIVSVCVASVEAVRFVVPL